MRLDLSNLKPWPISPIEKARIRKQGATSVEWQRMYDLLHQTEILTLTDPTFNEVMVAVRFVSNHYGGSGDVTKELMYWIALQKGK